MEKQSKKVLLTGVAFLSAFGVFAQGNGSAGITEATQMVTNIWISDNFGNEKQIKSPKYRTDKYHR